jgi:hypothetical protein
MRVLTTLIVLWITVMFAGTYVSGADLPQQVVGTFTAGFKIMDTDKDRPDAVYSVQLVKSPVLDLEGDKAIYKITLQIENQSPDIATLRIGPSSLTDKTGTKYKGLFWDGPVSLFNGPLGPREMFVKGEEKENISVNLKPGEKSARIYIRVRLPKGRLPSIFECEVGGRQSFLVHAKYIE